MHLDRGMQKNLRKTAKDLPVFHTNEQCGTELSREKDKKTKYKIDILTSSCPTQRLPAYFRNKYFCPQLSCLSTQ